MIDELDLVALTEDLPAHKLRAGDIGTVVLVYDRGAAFEVEFATLDGETLTVSTLPASAIRPLRPREIAHAREVA